MRGNKHYDPSRAKEYLHDSLGDLVEEKKQSSRLSQREIAEEIGIDKGTFSRYLNSGSEANISSLALIAEYFDVSTDFLLGRSKERTPKEDVLSAVATTGLSGEAILAIQKIGRPIKDVLDCLLRCPLLFSALVLTISAAGKKRAVNYLHDNIDPQRKELYEDTINQSAQPEYEKDRWLASREYEKLIDDVIDSLSQSSLTMCHGHSLANHYLDERADYEDAITEIMREKYGEGD